MYIKKLKGYVTKGTDYLKANKAIIAATVLGTGATAVVLGTDFVLFLISAGVIVYIAYKLDK